MNIKYFQPSAYFRKAKYTMAKLLFRLGISLRVTTIVDNVKIVFVAGSYTEYVLRARESFRREPVTMYWLREIVKPNEILYDIGANVGAYSLYAAQNIKAFNDGESGAVYAFEPAFSNFFSLCRNLEANHLNDIVVPFPVAFGEKRYETKFFLRSTTTGSALHGLDKPSSEGKSFEPAFVQGVGVLSLDEFVENHSIRFPNHIKIDVDGSEREIVLGAKKVLGDPRLKSIMIEINEDLYTDELDQVIQENGFDLIRVDEWAGRNTFNKLFCRRESPATAKR